MNIRLLILMVVASFGVQLNAGYFTTSYIAQGVVPAALIIGGYDCDISVVGAGLIGSFLVGIRLGLLLVRARHGMQLFKNVDCATKIIQIFLPLIPAYIYHNNAKSCSPNDQKDLRFKRDVFLGCVVAEALIQVYF